MEAKEIIDNIRLALKPLHETKQDVVSLPALENFLDELEKNAQKSSQAIQLEQDRNLVQFQAENQRYIAQLEMSNAAELEMFRSVISTGQSALKASMIINGGAVVALLAFIGNFFKSDILDINTLLALPVGIFCIGVLAAAMASGLTYLTQFLYHCKWEKIGIFLHVLTVVLVLGSYASFVFGSLYAIEALTAKSEVAAQANVSQ